MKETWKKILDYKNDGNLIVLSTYKELEKEDNKNSKCFRYYRCVSIILWLIILSLITVVVLKRQDPLIDIVYVDNEKNDISHDKVVSCYYNTPANDDASQLLPSNINPHLCTHINVAFAQVKNKQIFLTDLQIKTIADVLQIKNKNPNLKVLLSVGGAGNNEGFSDVVVNHIARKEFIKSIKYTLRNYTLDGIDLDWEFPALHQYSRDAGKRERQHFSQLLREIRMEYIREKRNYLLTVALAAPQIIVDVAYDVDQINLYVDYANIMTYDFHYYTQYTPFTGLNSPLYARNSEYFYMGTLNINYTIQMYLSKGLNQSKIVVGIPTYGHSFSLVNEDNADIGSPASGYGHVGGSGFVSYPEVCDFLKVNSNVSIVEEKNAKVSYLHKQSEWISFDSPQSVTSKAEYIKQLKLRGAMIYSLNSDDYKGLCGKILFSNVTDNFPLSASIRNIILT
ncbi:chitinase-3-like protein 1 [Pieris rapae]|uniref:chitinase-3-like protein 1 n=1 Tax=Pieris rapae TaxID=64459 RepID=UPI001E27DF66|nr:chitinase-3-like protein 1 [Pieris rapae]